MRISAILLAIVSLAACNRAKTANNDAVRQGVVEYLVSKGFDIPKAMTVSVTAVEVKGKEADATVTITPAGGDTKQGMTMRYRLEQKGDKWSVTGRSEHEGATTLPKSMTGAEPQGGAAGSPKMPSPEDLPPAKK